MIWYQRDGKHVKIKIDLNVPNYGEREIWSYWDCNSEVFAGLLANALQNEQDKRITKVRREAYEHGYKDGRAKRKKETFFSRFF